MTIMLVLFIFLFMIILLFFLFLIFSYKFGGIVKVTSFESGFTSVGRVQSTLSLHFFILVLIFIIFDLEVVLFLSLLMSSCGSYPFVFLLYFFVMGGLYLEWAFGKLVWVV